MSLAIKHECYYRALVDLLNDVHTQKEVEVLERIAEDEFRCVGEVIWLDKFNYDAMVKRIALELEDEGAEDEKIHRRGTISVR